MAITSLYNYRDNEQGFVDPGKHVVEGYVAGPASYVNGTGFDADIATDFSLPSGATVTKAVVTSDNGMTAKWAADKITAYSAFETEATNGDDLSAHTFFIKAWIAE